MERPSAAGRACLQTARFARHWHYDNPSTTLRMRLQVAALLTLLMVLPACKTGQPAKSTGEAPEATQKAARTAIAPGIWSVDSGEKLDEDTFWDALADHRFVIVGESHGTKWHHDVQLRTYRAMLRRHEARGETALGMEMFQRPYQAPLSAYAGGDIEESEMLERTEWESRWGMATEMYAPLWRTARRHRAPIVALNTTRELSRKVAEVGLEGLSEAERARLPDDLDTSNEAHRKLVREAFGQHGEGMSEAKFERFYQAQVVWDETMAHTAVEFMQAHPDLAAMVIVCGRFHAYPAFGIPPRIDKRLPKSNSARDQTATLLPITPETPEASMDLEEIRQKNLADFVWVRDGR